MGWLSSMLVQHRYTTTEASAALGLTAEEVSAAAQRFGIAADPARARNTHPRVLPYPGGRHPRLGFLDGAIRPRRDTKVSIFAPWADGGYAVADVPEAVWHDTSSAGRKLLFLAHTHLATIWDEQGRTLPPREWVSRVAEGRVIPPPPPSSNRTCRFPASGLPKSSRRGHAQAINRESSTAAAGLGAADGRTTTRPPVCGRLVDCDVASDALSAAARSD
jgi:hypothetical protein